MTARLIFVVSDISITGDQIRLPWYGANGAALLTNPLRRSGVGGREDEAAAVPLHGATRLPRETERDPPVVC